MKTIKELELGYPDAENYRRRENKQMLERYFIRNDNLDKLCDQSVSFLIGEKGTGKTAYSLYLANNYYKNNIASLKFIRETEYSKFITLKKNRHLDLSDYTSTWKVIILLLLSRQIQKHENFGTKILNFKKFNALQKAIDEYYANAFSPEIIQALQFVQEAKLAAELISKHAKASGEEREQVTFYESRFQVNIFYIQNSFKEALSKLKLSKNYILFIDGIDIRPSSIPYEEYIECIKGLANATWELNNDIFSSFRDSKGRIRVVLLIRPDIFNSLGLQNLNTKIRSNSVFLDWRTDYVNYRTSDLFYVFDHLLESQQELRYAQGDSWDQYFPWNSSNLGDEYSCKTSFVSFLRWSYYRPRDILVMIDILKSISKNQPEKRFFPKKDFFQPYFQRAYSNYLLGEIKDHLLFYYSTAEYNIFLKFFEFLSGRNRFAYSYYEIAFEKLNEHLKSLEQEVPQFMKTPNDFLQFLYDLNVLCYFENRADGKRFIHWCFKERNYANISPKVKTHAEYQIFYGLAKSLNVGIKYSTD